MDNTKEQRKPKGVFADPTVDFAFKRIFGSPQYRMATIGLLNSFLPTEKQISDVEFINAEIQGLAHDDRNSFSSS